VPSRLRPTAPIAPDAILVGDPGRALLLAQELIDGPKMSNHARGLWGYTGPTPEGRLLTVQSTGMGGPSAALVLGELAELGLRRAVRVGSCAASDPGLHPGALILVERAIAEGGSATAFGLEVGGAACPDRALTERLRTTLGAQAQGAAVASFDTPPGGAEGGAAASGAADMQTAALLARAAQLRIAAAAVLVVVESAGEGELDDAGREDLERVAGRASASVLSA
jgi:uridine phosphorylase